MKHTRLWSIISVTTAIWPSEGPFLRRTTRPTSTKRLNVDFGGYRRPNVSASLQTFDFNQVASLGALSDLELEECAAKRRRFHKDSIGHRHPLCCSPIRLFSINCTTLLFIRYAQQPPNIDEIVVYGTHSHGFSGLKRVDVV